MSKRRIKQWYEAFDGKVYVAFSGGKDSTVLLHLVRSIYPNVQGVFIDTGLEYPEIRDFVKSTSNIEWIKPKLTFKQVIDKDAYPVSEGHCLIIPSRHITKFDKLTELEINILSI